jgi:hypothetical protein
MGEGTGSSDMIWEGTTFTDGDTFFTMDPSTLGMTIGLTGGSDCDDADASTFGDNDGDGATYCTTDCDDSDPALNADDLDGDGFSTCDGDCNEDTADADGDGVADGVAFNPGVEEVYYDGIDQNCDGWSDYDADMDGDEAMEFDDGTGTMVAWTGNDCRDDNDNYLSLAMEADPTACYYDSDGDGYGDDTPSSTAESYGVIAGTDCYDFSDITYPGAAYMEADVDGDGVTDCTRDEDGDGWGDMSPSSWYNAMAGTDCDDDDAMLAPDLDADADGVFSCDDCDDMDATLQGGMVYDDMDGDGYGDMDDMGTLVCDLTDLDSDDDGTNDLSLDNTDCNDGDEFTFPAAGFNETGTLALECLTDADGDGYAAGIPASSLYEVAVVTGDCFDVTITDSYGDGCNGTVDMYVDYMLDVNIAGPAVYTVTEQWCATMDGTLQVGWTEASSFNYECGFSINDASGTEVYASSGTISDLVPAAASGGTDTDDSDGTVW